MENITVWVENLDNPIVLMGFGLFILAVLLKPLFSLSDKLSGVAIERLLTQAIRSVFVLAFLFIGVGFTLSFNEEEHKNKENNNRHIANQETANNHDTFDIQQKTLGYQSATINTKGDVSINYAN